MFVQDMPRIFILRLDNVALFSNRFLVDHYCVWLIWGVFDVLQAVPAREAHPVDR